MKNSKSFLNFWLPLLVLPVLCAACSETDYMTYDASHSGLYFTKDTLTYSFGVTPVEQRTKEYHIPVRVMGTVAGADRAFSCEVIADSTTAVEGVQYRMGTPVIPKDSINGYVPVILLRDGMEGDYQSGFVRYKLGVRLLAGNDFEPTLDSASQVRVLTFDNAVEQPEWYDAYGQKVWNERIYGKWHPLKLIKMVEYFHAMEGIQPEIYYAMVKAFGENLEKVPYGDFHPYSYAMKKHVYKPMYDYFSDPDNRQGILALYPDFPTIDTGDGTPEEERPFDFPDPFLN